MILLTRRERFNAAHRLFRPDWTAEKNTEVYGKCANPNWHGHNYVLLVTVKGEVNPELGYVVDLKTLSKLIREIVIDKLDHKNLNLEVQVLDWPARLRDIVKQVGVDPYDALEEIRGRINSQNAHHAAEKAREKEAAKPG